MKSFLDFLKEETPDLPFEEAAKKRQQEEQRQRAIAEWEAKHDRMVDRGGMSSAQIIKKIGPKPA